MNGGADLVFVLDGGLVAGGAERVATELLSEWAGAGLSVTLVTMRGPEEDFYPLPAGVRRVVLGGFTRSGNRLTGLFRNVVRLWRLRRVVRHSRPSVVLSFLTEANVRTVLACRGLGTRVVLSERNDASRQQGRWPWEHLRRLLYRHADVVTANSAIALASMEGYVPSLKLALVPNTVTVPPAAAKPDGSATILTVGRLVPQKNQALLLGAFARLGRERAGWRLVILGDGPLRVELEALASELGIERAVELRGLVPDPAPHYTGAAIFVLPSLYEGTPNALLEAMAHGLPCVVADSLPGALDHVDPGVTGVVFRSGDEADLADRVRTLMADPALRMRLGAAARDRMRRFDRQRVLALWNGILFPGR